MVFDAWLGLDSGGDIDRVGAEGLDDFSDIARVETSGDDDLLWVVLDERGEFGPVEGLALSSIGTIEEEGVDFFDLLPSVELGLDGDLFVFECFDHAGTALFDEFEGFFAVELEGVCGADLFDGAELVDVGDLHDPHCGDHWRELEHDRGGFLGVDVSRGVLNEDETDGVGAVVYSGLCVFMVGDAADFDSGSGVCWWGHWGGLSSVSSSDCARALMSSSLVVSMRWLRIERAASWLLRSLALMRARRMQMTSRSLSIGYALMRAWYASSASFRWLVA